MDEITAAIAGLTRRLHAYRVFNKGEFEMVLEIKGLKGKALKARANIDALNAAYDSFNERAPAHAADVAGLTEQVTGMGEDLEFAVNVLGNSTSESEKLAEKPKAEPVVKVVEPPAIAQEVAETASTTFPAA